MRIVEDSVSRLVLRDRTLWITVMCFLAPGLMIIQSVTRPPPVNFYTALLVAGIFGLAFLQMTDVVFDKARRVATLRKLTVIRLTRATLQFADTVDVTVQIAPQPDGVSITCRLAFQTRDDVMTASYEPNLERHNAMRDAILRARSVI
jgi:hypothetical protein